MNHFVLTRWNLPGCLEHSSLELVVDPRWRTRRLQLFEDYCLPSVTRQTVTDFVWLFLVDARSTSERDLQWFRTRDERLRVVRVDDQRSSGAPEACDAISSFVAGDDWVITTRLDSDDVLHPDHLRRVRVPFDGERTFVQFTNGFYYDVLRDDLRHRRELKNPFVSVLEPAAALKTAWAWEHHRIGEDNEVHFIEAPGWVALVHDRNTTTSIWGDPVSGDAKRAVLAEFGVARPPYLKARVERLRAHGRRVRRVAGRTGRRASHARLARGR